MPRTHPLPVHLSRDTLHEIEAAESYEATGSFDVEITNHGRDAHPHLKLSDSLASVATLQEGNPYVASGDSVRIRVDATPRAEPVTGILKIETGYGAESTGVRVTVRQATEEEMPVDETLGKPQAEESQSRSSSDWSAPDLNFDSGTLPVAVLALVALAIAVVTGLVVEDVVVVAGVAVVLVAVVGAGVLLLR